MENITTDVCSDFTANVLLDAQLKNVIKSDSDLRHGVRFGGCVSTGFGSSTEPIVEGVY